MVLVSLLIGLKNGARTLNQSLSEVIMNQSNYLITFDTQLKTALMMRVKILVMTILMMMATIKLIKTSTT